MFKQNGIIIFSTINRSYLAYITTIFLAEKILRLVPAETHDWNMYVKPEEILDLANKNNFKIDKICGLFALPSLNGFKWIRVKKNTKVNYIISLVN